MSWRAVSSWAVIVLSLVSMISEYRFAHTVPAAGDELSDGLQTPPEQQGAGIVLPQPSTTAALLKQSIFTADRSAELSPQTVAEPTEHTLFLNHYRLSAVAITDNTSMVLMTDDKTKKVKQLQLNDELDEWTLEEITSTAAVFNKAGQRRRVMLFNAKTPSLATTVSATEMSSEQDNPTLLLPGSHLDDDPYQ